jgi:DNA-3-methyladenine glycosylase
MVSCSLPTAPTPLARSFYEPSAQVVAPLLLGHWLVRRTSEGFSGGVIVETEAYVANDPSCHAYRGETRRNRAMFGPPGRAYVYFIYGNHWCFNAVCCPAGTAEAVLLRALEPGFGLGWMQQRRAVSQLKELTNGPAKFCAALGIDRQLDHADLCANDSPIQIAENPARARVVTQLGPVITTTRVGLSQASDWPLRFYLEGSAFVSRRVQRRGP